MPTPYPNALTGLNQGLQQGLQMGLLIRQQKQAEQARLDAAKQQEIQNTIKKATMAMTIVGDQNMPEAIRLKAYNEGLAPAWNTLNPNSPMGKLDALPSHAAEYAKKALKIWNNPDYDTATKQEALNALLAEATTKNEQVSIANMQGQLKQQQESSNLVNAATARQQMAATPGLAQSLEAMNFAQQDVNRMLGNAGTAGTDILKEQMKPAGGGNPSVRVVPAPNGYKSPSGTNTGFVYSDLKTGNIMGDAPNPSTAATERAKMYKYSRPTQQLDINPKSPTYGQTVTVSLGDVEDNPGHYISTSDPNFKAITKNIDYQRMNENYLNTIENYSGLVTNLMQQTGLNQHSKFWNYGLQDLLANKVLGSGDVNSLNLTLAGLEQEIAKIENGSLGIGGAPVETARKFSNSLNPNMPFKDLVKVLDWAQSLGHSRLDAIQKNNLRILDRARKGIFAPTTSTPDNSNTSGKNPSVKEWMDAAIKANPGTSKTELLKYYKNKYGKGQ